MEAAIKPTYIFLTAKPWNDIAFSELEKNPEANWVRMKSKDEFQLSKIASLRPDRIFIPHWSYIIPPEIFKEFECIVFHMTDLPYGRGGSPLQNLIVRGHKKTKISAFKVEEGLDAGPIYLKKDLHLDGSADEVFKRASGIIKEMIEEIIEDEIKPVPQNGDPVVFKRRGKKDGEISALDELEKVYDHIRMLDCEGYPNAFLETAHFLFEFSNAFFSDNDKSITGNVRIIKK
jgi:methionyl-tRNA formyltransferase